MKLLKAWKSILSFSLLALGLSGFTGAERYVELEGFLNGRTQAKFRAQDRNVQAVLTKGTRGEVLQTTLLSSGNYGILVKTMNGAHAGQKFWVYYKVSQPALKVYETAPASWNVGDVQKRVAETLRDVGAYKDPLANGGKVPLPIPRGGTGVDGDQSAGEITPAQNLDHVMTQVDQANALVRQAGGDPSLSPENCPACIGTNIPIPKARPAYTPRTQTKPETQQTRVYSQQRDFGNACYRFVKQDGSYGDWGQKMAAIMKEPTYKRAFTRNTALGDFCPKFSQLNEDQKIQAWTWFWGSLGAEESTTCDLNKYHAKTYVDKRGRVRVLNPNEGWGIWALEKDPGLREDRGEACKSISGIDGQARCAIDIMFKRQLARGKTASTSDQKYWGPTYNARNQTQIMPHMRRFSACF